MLALAVRDYKFNLNNCIVQQLGCVKTKWVTLQSLVAISRSGAGGFRARARAGVRRSADPARCPWLLGPACGAGGGRSCLRQSEGAFGVGERFPSRDLCCRPSSLA